MSEVTEKYRTPGKPPKSPKNKLSTPVRCLVTIGVEKAIEKLANDKGILVSDMMRLALYNQFAKEGILTDELRRDATWDELRGLGLV